MKNPITEAREELNLTLSDFAERAGVAQSFIENVEAGLATKVPRSIRDALFRAQDDAGFDHTFNLDADYDRWISWERAAVVGEPWPEPRPYGVYNGQMQSPFWQFRYDMMGGDNRRGFCLLFKLPPATVMRYEQGTTSAMPRVIEQALIDTDYPYLLELADLQAQWRERTAV